VIRFSAALVVVAIGVLIGGVATSSLLLVYVAIGISAAALLVLAVGVALKRDELLRDDVRPVSAVVGVNAGQQADLGQQPASSVAGDEADESRVPVTAARGSFGSASTRGDRTRRDSPWADPASRDDTPARQGSGFAGRPASATPESRPHGTAARPGAWPPPEPGFPVAPAAKAGTPPAARTGAGRPPAPPTRADPVLPWSESLPTRADVARVKSPDPVPSWLDDVDDESASATTGTTVGVPAGTWRTEEAGGDALPSWGDTSWKTDPADFGTGRDDDFVATADDAGIDDVDTDDNDTGIDHTHIDADTIGLDDTRFGDAADSGAAGSGFTAPSRAGEADADEDAAESADARVSSGAQEVTVVPGVPRYHDPNCILIRFMPADDVQRMSVPEAEKAGCTPCRACQSE
jgi:hypothetical protein